MRPTDTRKSEMPGPKVYAAWWGDKGGIMRQKGIITYSMSPFKQRAAHHLIRSYVLNGYRRLAGQFVYWSIPFAIGYSTYAWAKSHDAWQNSKAAHAHGHGAH